MTVAVIVRENILITEELQAQLTKVLTNLVVNEWATTFLFADVSNFDKACYEIVSQLKTIFVDMQRVFVGEYKRSEYNKDWVLANYERAILPENEAVSFEARDQAMVDRCDVLVTCCDIFRELNSKWKTNTAMAVAYAWKKKKRIINVFDM